MKLGDILKLFDYELFQAYKIWHDVYTIINFIHQPFFYVATVYTRVKREPVWILIYELIQIMLGTRVIVLRKKSL